MSSTLVVGMFGYGVVGGGVVKLLEGDGRFKFKCVCVRDANKPRDVPLPPGCKLTTNPKDILEDSEIQLVVEVAGGVTAAKDITFTALEKGKHVVSANKALISAHLDDLVALQAKAPKTYFMFEAAVCGGIPIISVFQRSLACDKIMRVTGIMNGTTNYILTKMRDEGLDYRVVLQDAKNKGYAEADESADVEGWDARSKLCILAKLAFGITVDEKKVFCQGITQITSADFKYAEVLGKAVKHLGIAERTTGSDGKEKITIYLAPCLVPLKDALASVQSVTNAVEVVSSNLSTSVYIGPGAGRLPTANSVVADMMDLHAKSAGGTSSAPAQPPFPSGASGISGFESDFETAFYLRFLVNDKVGIIQKLAEALASQHISIHSIQQTPIENPKRVPFVIITEKTKLSTVQSFMKSISGDNRRAYDFLVDDPFCMPFLEF
uniref:Homoserine dehydrogenase n=1 Tax=Chromera velia CCMP2878 TaxID=1169474 RepID=A0A0G4I1Z8_9ALVE|mmetsp:Transcript_16365/g.33258  ORF Transcript_16365/g.33258 Transcript_16365/m.33258 type:complete len:437 (+) Transcript_16365:206-1516(+)|eukprot:Cvel_10269.t1-p1 / transcript=Cvel_10269.t1 / gene=Cvel_10269 / organism=Chromera_velia_CCMP2878 / gene_product=Homoserine dehydrogenase, putative / transcript_product=Homoserine dehydrogenase, putative / location=Cvel_scaffold616:11444-13590(+) / protein_length=436 / sequence_SO=supercontig / SO=protein_coding / is_pseudo=false